MQSRGGSELKKRLTSAYPRDWYFKTQGACTKTIPQETLREINAARVACELPEIDEHGNIKQEKQAIDRVGVM